MKIPGKAIIQYYFKKELEKINGLIQPFVMIKLFFIGIYYICHLGKGEILVIKYKRIEYENLFQKVVDHLYNISDIYHPFVIYRRRIVFPYSPAVAIRW
jgi:hypothetical protein